MRRELPLLDNMRIAAPCPVSWSAMQGDDRVRYCEHCKLNVFDLSTLTREAAESLIREREGRLCVTYFQRSDGTVITANCPVGLARVRKRLAWIASGFGVALTAAMFLFSAVAGLARQVFFSGAANRNSVVASARPTLERADAVVTPVANVDYPPRSGEHRIVGKPVD